MMEHFYKLFDMVEHNFMYQTLKYFGFVKPLKTLYKSSHLYLYSALYNTDCVKAALQCQQENSLSIMQEDTTNKESFSS